MKLKKMLTAALLFAVAVVASAQTFTVNNLAINGNSSQAAQTAATSSANQNSGTAGIAGNYWNGAASAADSWQVQNVLGTGTNPSSTLTFTHSGSTGTATVNVPVTYTNTATGGTTRTAQSKLADTYHLLDFAGCDPTGTTDSTTCIQNAINAVGTGGELDIQPGTYNISSTLTLGNGSVSAQSTTYGQKIIGLMGGTSATETNFPKFPIRLVWTGAANGTMMIVNGPIWGVRMSGLTFDANNIANTCLIFNHPITSKFDNLQCIKYRGAAFAHNAYAEPAGVVVGSSDNIFENITAKNPGLGGSGIIIGSSTYGTSKYLDVARNTYLNDHFDYDSTTGSTSYGIALQFVDNVTFIETATQPANGGTAGVGIFVNPPTGGTGSLNFPGAVQFYNSPIIGGVAAPSIAANWTTPTGIGFWPYPIGDGEALPTSGNPGGLYGVTDSGIFFGTGGGNPVRSTTGLVSYGAHIVTGAVQLAAGTATVTFTGGAIFTNASQVCTANDNSNNNAVKVVKNSGSSMTFTSTGTTDFINYVCIGN